MNALATLDNWYSAPGSKKALLSPSKRDRCVCMPDPACSRNGLGMKEADTPCSIAVSCMTWRKVITLSAMDSASAYLRSISCWPGAPSWWEYSTEMPIASRVVMAVRRKSCPTPRGA